MGLGGGLNPPLVPVGLRSLVFDPWSLCKTEVHLKISEHKMLRFSVRKEIIENGNSWVVISLSKVGKNEFVQTL